MQNQIKPEVRFEWISEGWRMFTAQWKQWVLNTLVYCLISFAPLMAVVLGLYGYIIVQATQHSRSSPQIAPGVIGIFYLAIFGAMVIAAVVGSFLIGGMHLSALKQLRGETI